MRGLGTDGASAMTGKIKGLVGLVRESVPSVVAVHCASHRLHLVAADILKDPEFAMITAVDDALKQLTKYVNDSNNRTQDYEMKQIEAGLKALQLPPNYEQRWQAKKKLTNHVFGRYKPIVTLLDHMAAKGEEGSIVPARLAA
jgi:hypothetical protein